ncbi:MAG: AAA family ATPase, partial [Olegusella sp.]|nr:AAA family ATPase [Olegusella sp.]
MRVIAICNQKGGVGKSTTAEALASSLVRRGARVLCVDMDAQPGNMSLHAGADKSHAGTRELLSLKKPTREEVLACIQGAGPFGDICSADRDLEDIDAELASRVGREHALSRALATISDDYDFAVVDTPPALW